MSFIAYLKRLFKPKNYISEADQLLASIRQKNIDQTPGRVIKRKYYQALAEKRDQLKIVKKKNQF